MPPHHDDFAYPPRGLSRDQAARYIGIGPTLFDEMVADGRMPRPKRVNGRVVWDRLGLDSAFNDLPGGETNAKKNKIDEALQRRG